MPIFKRLNINTSRREAQPGRTLDANIINTSFEEISQDLNNLASYWNQFLLPLLTTLPNGTEAKGGTDLIDSFVSGLSGKTIYTDATATNTSIHYNVTNTRPRTLCEELDSLFTSITTINSAIAALQVSAAGGITAAQKAAIGDHIFDAGKTSSGTSLDGKVTALGNNIIQVAKDVYGTDYAFTGTTDALLTQSIKAMINAVLAIHGGAWTDKDTIDITLSHSALPEFIPLRTYIGQTSPEVTQPDYSSVNIVTQGASLTTAIGELDTGLNAANTNINTIQGDITTINNTLNTIQSGSAPVFLFDGVKTADYTAHTSELICTDTTNTPLGITITLPSAASCAGKTIIIKQIRHGDGYTTVQTVGDDLIETTADVFGGTAILIATPSETAAIQPALVLMSLGDINTLRAGEIEPYYYIRWVVVQNIDFSIPVV